MERSGRLSLPLSVAPTLTLTLPLPLTLTLPLTLARNAAGAPGGHALEQALKGNHTLLRAQLSGNRVPADCLERIEARLALTYPVALPLAPP